MLTASKNVIRGWAMYDWASSAYSLVITSTILPAYFEAVAVDNKEVSKTAVTFLGRQFENSSLYNYSIAFAMLVVAITSPLLSSIADFSGQKKKFMNFFMTMGALACAMLFFFERDKLGLGISAIIVACIGFWGAQVFYNSFLLDIARPEDRDRVSAQGFSYGYVGSVILQLICFVLVFFPGIVGGNEETSIQFRTCFVLVAIWWWSFGQFSLRRLPKPLPAGSGNPRHRLFVQGYRELKKVWGQVKQIRPLKRYLAAFFFYNMGVQTVMLVAALYGKIELEIPTDNLIISILIIQLIAVPGAFAISWLSSRIGNFRTLMIVVLLWIGICAAGYFVPKGGVYEFYALGAAVGFLMGGIQSLSRSTHAKLVPEGTRDTVSFFSFYDVTEKVASVIGIFTFGFITDLTGSQRNSVLALATFFGIGLLLLIYAAAAVKPQTHETVQR